MRKQYKDMLDNDTEYMRVTTFWTRGFVRKVSAKKKKMSVSDAIVESNINAQQTSAELLRLCSETAAIKWEERKRAHDQQERQWEWDCGYHDRKLNIEHMQAQVALIRSLRDMGLSPEEIRGYLDGGDAGHLGL